MKSSRVQVAKNKKNTLRRRANGAAHDEDDLLRSNPERGGSQTSPFSDVMALQQMVGNRATQHLLTSPTPVMQRMTTSSLVQRDAIPVQVIDVPKKKGTVKDIVLDTMNTTESIFVNYDGALDIFERVVDSSSKEEAAPKSTGLIVLEEVSKFAFKKVIDEITELVPGGKYVKDLIELSKSTLEAIEAEKKRSGKATEENSLKDFIVKMRKQIRTGWSQALQNKQDIAVEAQDVYDKKSTGDKEVYRRFLEVQNKLLTDQANSIFSINSLFTQISEGWINESKAPDKEYAAEVLIKLDKDWNVLSAYIDAPRGSRIAEELSNSGAQKVDLTSFDVPRHIMWYPLSDQEGGGLAWCEAQVDAKGHASQASANYFGSSYFNQFIKLLGSKPIPESTKISGFKTSG